jgi:hypothetical protein
MARWTCIRDWLARPQCGRLEPGFSRTASRPTAKVRRKCAIEIIGLAARRGEAPAVGWSAPDGAILQFGSAIGRWAVRKRIAQRTPVGLSPEDRL